MDVTIPVFNKGVQNLYNNEVVDQAAAQDALGFISQDGREKLIGGRKLIGTDGVVGMIRGLWFGYKNDGTQILYRKTETKLQYLNGSTWTDILTGLTSGSEASFANYSSLAGAFTFFVTVDGYWKINNANPTDAIQMYDSTKNFHGRIFIDKGRTILYARRDAGTTDLTGLYGSHIDPQNATVYTTVTGEATTSLTGTLAFKAGGSTRNCFGVKITLTGTGEVYTDNFNGVLTGSLGGTGTINYATGAYTVSNAGVGTANYQWEDSNIKGLTDFTKSATRLAGEGFVVPQDAGGDPINIVLIGQDGGYYSLKQQSAYRFLMDDTDLNPSNIIYYQNIGVPSPNAGVSTQKGIIFINTSNPDKPEMTILQKSAIGDDPSNTGSNIIPIVLFSHFKFSNYDFSDSYFNTYERYIVVSCKQQGSINNDRILLLNISDGTVNVSPYEARMFAKDNSANLFVGSPVVQSVHQIYNGFDDLGNALNAYWTSKADKYSMPGMKSSKWRFISEFLKKFRRLRVKGRIDPNQRIEVYCDYDESGFQLIGVILGSGDYVDYNNPQAIGNNFIGQAQVGGDDITNVYPYFIQIKPTHQPKFRKRTLKFVPTGIGYFDFEFISDWDIMIFEAKQPKRFRQKQKINLTTGATNQ